MCDQATTFGSCATSRASLEIIARALHVRVVGGHFRQDEKSASRIFVFSSSACCASFCALSASPADKSLLGRDQQLAFLRTRQMQQFRIGVRRKRDLRRSLLLFSNVDVADQITVGIG